MEAVDKLQWARGRVEQKQYETYIDPPYRPSSSEDDEEEEEGEEEGEEECSDGVIEEGEEQSDCGRAVKTPNTRSVRSGRGKYYYKLILEKAPRHKFCRWTRKVAARTYVLWPDASDSIILDVDQTQIYTVSTAGYVTCHTQDWRQDPGERCRRGPGEHHDHSSLQLHHQSDISLRLINRTYICGAGKVWDPVGWPRGARPTLRRRFDAGRLWMRKNLFPYIKDEDLHPIWLKNQDDPDATDETWFMYQRVLLQGDKTNGTVFPSGVRRAISRLHLPLPSDAELLQLVPMLKQKWSNILQLCRVDEWVADGPSKRKGKGRKGVASAEPGALSLCVRSKRDGGDERAPFISLHPENRGHLALIDDELLGENFVLPADERYQPVDGPLARRGVFLPMYKCKYPFHCILLCCLFI